MAHVPRKLALFMTAWLAAALIFAGVFVIAKHNHEHIDAAGRSVPAGGDCHICLVIQIALRLIESFGRLGVSFFIAGFIASVIPLIKTQTVVFVINPIVLKVKLNC